MTDGPRDPTEQMKCTFCGVSRERTRKLIQSPDKRTFICEGCTLERGRLKRIWPEAQLSPASVLFSRLKESFRRYRSQARIHCSFCQTKKRSRDFYASARLNEIQAQLCGECLDACRQILEDEAKQDSPIRIIWDGDSETDCVEVCRELKCAGIVYRVAQQRVSRAISVDYRFQVGVLDCEYESARAALGLSAAADDNVEDQAFEIPESIGPISKPGQLEDESRAARSYLRAWHPENATVEIWSQVIRDTIVTVALRENLIHYRLRRAENGAYKLFVLPEDESRAREIIREIEKGEPPK